MKGKKPRKYHLWMTKGEQLDLVAKRKNLRDATTMDRCLIALFFLVSGAAAGWILIWLISSMLQPSSRWAAASMTWRRLTEILSPWWNALYWVFVIGGGACALGWYIYHTMKDPYGTVQKTRARDRAAAEARRRAEAMHAKNKRRRANNQHEK